MTLDALRRSAASTLAVGVLLAGCSASTSDEDPSSTATDRVEAVVTARDRVVEPAQALGTAAAAVASRLDQLLADPDPAPAEATRDALDELVDARDRVAELALDADTDDVRRAASALDAAVAAADDLIGSVGPVVEAVEVVNRVDGELEELVAVWDEPGSRSQLLEQLDEVTAAADEIAATDVAPGCAGIVDVRVAAAAFVGDATRELRDLVSRRDGTAFDARRGELAEAPWGRTDDGEPRALDGPVEAASCTAVEDARAAAAEVAAALRDLQQALNPADLAG